MTVHGNDHGKDESIYRVRSFTPVKERPMRDRVDVGEVVARVKAMPGLFLIPDVTPGGASQSVVFHIVRDLVETGEIRHRADGYYERVGSSE